MSSSDKLPAKTTAKSQLPDGHSFEQSLLHRAGTVAAFVDNTKPVYRTTYHFIERPKESCDLDVHDSVVMVDQDVFIDEMKFRTIEVFRHINWNKATGWTSFSATLKLQSNPLSLPEDCIVEELPSDLPRSEIWMNFCPDPDKEPLWWVYVEFVVDAAQKKTFVTATSTSKDPYGKNRTFREMCARDLIKMVRQVILRTCAPIAV